MVHGKEAERERKHAFVSIEIKVLHSRLILLRNVDSGGRRWIYRLRAGKGRERERERQSRVGNEPVKEIRIGGKIEGRGTDLAGK